MASASVGNQSLFVSLILWAPEHHGWWYSFELVALDATTLGSVGIGLGWVTLMAGTVLDGL